jgi:hypothetical protein
LLNSLAWTAGGCLVGSLVVGGVIALAPIAHRGEGEWACGSLLSHRQVTDAAPATIATKDYPASPGSPGLNHSDACPAEDFEQQRGTLAVAAPIGGLVVGAATFLARRAAQPAT